MAILGYQFDKMRVSPKADALLYNYLNGRNSGVIAGYGDELKVLVTGNTMTVLTGAAIIQGRLVVVDSPINVTAPSNSSKILCITIDLSQNNTSTGDPTDSTYMTTNNQLTMELRDSLLQQDLQNGGLVYTQPLGKYGPDASGAMILFAPEPSFYQPFTTSALLERVTQSRILYYRSVSNLQDPAVSPTLAADATGIRASLFRLGSIVICQLAVTIKAKGHHSWKDVLVIPNGFSISSVNTNVTGVGMAQAAVESVPSKAWCYINGNKVASIINNTEYSDNREYSAHLQWITEDDYPGDYLVDNPVANAIGLKWPLR